MVARLPGVKSPGWLTKLSPDSIINGPFPLESILRTSLFYPASGFDSDPIRYLSGSARSFVYADYGRDRDEFMQALGGPEFHDFEVLAIREIEEAELAPLGWRLPTREFWDGVPNPDDMKPPFFRWVVMEGLDDLTVNYEPRRISLLYLCIDGVKAYQTLYVERGLAPKVIAIIQPGYGFGGNYTDFQDPKRMLGRTVMGSPAGPPKFLLFGGIGERADYSSPCWPGYEHFVKDYDKFDGGYVGIWAHIAF